MTWRDRIELEVAVGLRGASVGESTWDGALWDDGTWGGADPVFVALEGCEVDRLRMRRGRSSATQRVSAGTLEVGLAWRSPAGGQWSFRPTAPVSLLQEIRVRARVDGGAWIPVYRGAVREVLDVWRPDNPVFHVTVRAVDRMAQLAAVNLPEQAAAGAGDTTEQRLGRIDALAGVPAVYERFGAGVITVQASTFARNLLDEAQVTVESEVGLFYADRESNLTFRPRFWQATDERAAVPRLRWTNESA